jgi:hypothetical protein
MIGLVQIDDGLGLAPRALEDQPTPLDPSQQPVARASKLVVGSGLRFAAAGHDLLDPGPSLLREARC